jgi:hypothetical protein
VIHILLKTAEISNSLKDIEEAYQKSKKQHTSLTDEVETLPEEHKS